MIPVRSNRSADKCASVALPVEPSQRGGPSVTLRLTRFRAIRSPRAGIILRLVRPGAFFGGLSREWWLSGQSSPSDRFDVIGVELDFESIAAGNCSVDPHELGLDPFADRASIESITDFHARALASCLVKSPTPPAFVDGYRMSSLIDQVRAVLGQTELTLTADFSTGLVALRYAQNYPARVRALLLEDPRPPDQETAAVLTRLADRQKDFEKFAAACAADPGCPLQGGAGPKARVEALLARYDGEQRTTIVDSVAQAAADRTRWFGLAVSTVSAESQFPNSADATSPGSNPSDHVVNQFSNCPLLRWTRAARPVVVPGTF